MVHVRVKIAIILFFPQGFVRAGIVINEVMYDLDGADTVLGASASLCPSRLIERQPDLVAAHEPQGPRRVVARVDRRA